MQFKLDGANLGAEDTTAPYSIAWDTTTVPNGAHTLTAVARDPSANAATSASVPVTVANTGPPPGLVAAYGFDTGSGTAVTDAVGQRQQRHADERDLGRGDCGPLRQRALLQRHERLGHRPRLRPLDLTSGMTLEAWINPTALGNTWRTVALKEQPGYYAYGLYASTGAGTSVPSGNGMIGGIDRDVRGTAQLPLNTWTHLATTYDGSALRLYVNGTQVGDARRHRRDRHLHRCAQVRRQRPLGRVVRRPDRRAAGLQPGVDAGRDPGRHDAAGDQCGFVCADCARCVVGCRVG